MAPPVGALARFLLRLALNLYGWFAVVVLSLKRWFSGNTGTAAEERIMTGRAWAEFCDTLKAAGATVLAPGAPRDAFNQAEGYRYLARLTRAGLENFVECADVEAPRLCAIANGSRAARVCIGSDNPDNLYESATIDGTLEYVVTGRRGTVGYLGFGTQSGQYGAKGGLETVDYIEADQLKYDAPPTKGSGKGGGRGTAAAANARFTIVLSATRPADPSVNWLRLKPAPREAMFIVRQTFGDRAAEEPASLQIVMRRSAGSGAGQPGVPPRLTAERLDAGLQSAGVLVAGASAMFARWAYDFQRHTNRLPLFDQERSNKAGGDPNIRYYHSYWRLQPGLAMVIRFVPPRCRCWNFQLNNHWMESLDYRHHAVHTNSTLARPNPSHDGDYTIIVSHDDPNADGVFRGNWIECTGHECGTMCFRWVAPEVDDALLPQPKVELVPYAALVGSSA